MAKLVIGHGPASLQALRDADADPANRVEAELAFGAEWKRLVAEWDDHWVLVVDAADDELDNDQSVVRYCEFDAGRWVVECFGERDRRWTQEGFGEAMGPGHTEFGTQDAAEAVRVGLVRLNSGWTLDNTRVRDTSVKHYSRESRVMYAVVDNDGMNPVVWGIGNTEREALTDAAQQDGYEATQWQCVVSISDVRAARIESGDVSADDLVTCWGPGSRGGPPRKHDRLFPAKGHDPYAG